jgi:DNA-binding IclR family transcriptional regulator
MVSIGAKCLRHVCIADRITKETGETTIYSEYPPSKCAVMHSAKSDSPHSLRLRINLFQESPVEWGASGSAIRAFVPSDVQAEIQREAELISKGPLQRRNSQSKGKSA